MKIKEKLQELRSAIARQEDTDSIEKSILSELMDETVRKHNACQKQASADATVLSACAWWDAFCAQANVILETEGQPHRLKAGDSIRYVVSDFFQLPARRQLRIFKKVYIEDKKVFGA